MRRLKKAGWNGDRMASTRSTETSTIQRHRDLKRKLDHEIEARTPKGGQPVAQKVKEIHLKVCRDSLVLIYLE